MPYITHNFCCIEVRRVKVQAFLFQISCKEWAFTLQGTSTLIVALLVELCKSKPSKKWLYTIHSRETSTRGDVWTNWLIAWCPQPRELLSLNLRNKNTPPPLATKPNSLKSFSYTKTVTSFSVGHLFFCNKENGNILNLLKLGVHIISLHLTLSFICLGKVLSRYGMCPQIMPTTSFICICLR